MIGEEVNATTRHSDSEARAAIVFDSGTKSRL